MGKSSEIYQAVTCKDKLVLPWIYGAKLIIRKYKIIKRGAKIILKNDERIIKKVTYKEKAVWCVLVKSEKYGDKHENK